MEKRFETFNYLIFKIAKMTQKIKNIEMSGFDLKAVHVMCIYHLRKHASGLTSRELVDLTLEDKAAISRALSALKEKDLIDYDGGYNALVTLTNKGNEIANFIEEKSKLALDYASKDISEEERIALYSTLSKIEKNMEDYYNDLSKS